MGFKKLPNLATDRAFSVGGKDKDGNNNPTQVEGYYIGAKKVPNEMTKTGISLLHIFQTAEGNVGVWGKTSLDAQLAGVMPGMMTRVTFTGFIKSNKPGRKPAYGYQVEIDDANSLSLDETATATNDLTDDEEYEDADLFAADEQPAGSAYVPPTTPKVAAKAPTAEQQAKVRAMLNGSRARS